MWNQKPSFRLEIDNFSEKEAAIASPTFVSGGCEWFLNVYPKGDSRCDDHLSLYLYVANSKSLGMGWKRSAYYYFVVFNQSDKELSKSFVQQYSVFREKSRGWGFQKALPLSKLQEKGCFEKDRLIIEVYIKVVEAFDGEGRDVPEKKETVDINGFQVLASQVTLARKIFAEHPDIAEDFKPKHKVVKTEYMNVLLNFIETLDKLSRNHSETELNNAYSKLDELMEKGFKLNWLKSKIDGVSLKSKKADGDGFRVQQLEQGVKTIELMELERKKSDDADGSRFQQLEERVKNLELMMSDLKTELDKEKAKSFADDFLLVD